MKQHQLYFLIGHLWLIVGFTITNFLMIFYGLAFLLLSIFFMFGEDKIDMLNLKLKDRRFKIILLSLDNIKCLLDVNNILVELDKKKNVKRKRKSSNQS